MRRWSFFSGLTIILLLLMGLGGFCIWITRGLTADIQAQVASNYDTIRAIRELNSANTRINATHLTVESVDDLHTHLHLYENERAVMQRSMEAVLASISEPGEAELSNRLKALLDDYLAGMDALFGLTSRKNTELRERQANLGGKARDIAEVTAALVKLNDDAIFRRHDHAVERGQQAVYLALGLVSFSLLVYTYTSVRLAQGVYQPLIRLRDSIVRLRESQFTEIVPLEGSDELGQIAATFNQMATSLRTYLLEQDEKFVTVSRRSRAILEALPKPVYIVDNDLNIVLMNPRAERLSAGLGVPGTLPSLVRQRMDEASARGVELVDDDLRRAIAMEWEDPEKGTVRTSFLPQVFRMKSELDAPEGWAVLLMDVTNLRQIDAAKSKAIATLGHEVKTPVTGIRMTLHLLLEEKIGSLTPDQRELLESGRADCERLLAVLQALLELARLESGRAVMKLNPVSPAALLTQVDAMHGSLAANTGRELQLDPPAPAEPEVLADLLHAGRVLGNFVSNALKYGAPGSPVFLRACPRADGYVRFSVINQSVHPLNEAEQARVFEPFYRRPGEVEEGSGLGLTISREIAMLHGGRVGAWSNGNEIEFYLDLRVYQA